MTAKPLRFAHLSPQRQALVRLFQSIEFGHVLDLQVRDREPVFNPPPRLLLEIKLDTSRKSRPELETADFELCDEVRSLLDRVDQMETGFVQRIEVRAGIPRRVLIEAKLTEIAI